MNKKIVSIIILIVSLISLSIYAYYEPDYIQKDVRRRIVNYLNYKYGDGDFKVIRKNEYSYTVKTSYMDSTFEVNGHYHFSDNFLDDYASFVWQEDYDKHMRDYIENKVNSKIDSNDGYFNISIYDEYYREHKGEPNEEILSKNYNYKINQFIITKDSDDEEEIDNLLIKAYDAISNETNSNILIFRFENRENPYQKDSKINYSEGSISKKRNSYYIYYGKYYKKIDN